MKPLQTFVRGLMAMILLMVALHAPSAIASDAVLLRFNNGESITEKDLSEYLARRVDLRAVSRSSWGVENVLREMAMTRVLLLEHALMESHGETTKYRFDDKSALPVHKKLMPICNAPADDAAARLFYEQNPEAFRIPPMARLSRVMLPTKDQVEGVPAGLWLLSQAQAVGSGKKTFDEVVQQASEVHKLDAQGDLGWVVLAEEASILRAIASSSSGDMVGPVGEGDYVYFFHILAKRDGRLLAWDEVSATASGRAVRYCREQGAVQLRDRLFKKYGVVIDQAAVRAMFHRKELKK